MRGLAFWVKSLVILILFILPFIAIASEDVEVFVQLGHTDWVKSVAISPDGRYALSGSWD